jgi:cell division protein FtsN
LLKETEILVPDDQDSANATDPEIDAVYVLQAGSFKNIRDAENLKVELLLMNLLAESESVKSKNGDIWHRVLVGPFTDTSKMASARAKLAENNIDSLKLKRKQ